MTDIILHHYDTSPYAEKVRTGLGLKGLAWASIELPQIMPKPNLTALTGGYRKTPVLQIGADIYCDSQLIMRELERRHPTPSFYPAGRGAADALAWWAEKTMFLPAVSIAFAKRPEVLPKGFLEDRAKFSGRNIDPVVMLAAVPNQLDQLRAHFDWLDQTLADGRSFLQGRAVGLSDLAAYHPVWYLRQNFGSAAAPLDGFPRLLSWAERVAAIGHGRRSSMTSKQALDVARTATSIATASTDAKGSRRPEAWPGRQRCSGRYRTRSCHRRIGYVGHT
jgi:glutathione S-transferase